jgi:hypothetical protein
MNAVPYQNFCYHRCLLLLLLLLVVIINSNLEVHGDQKKHETNAEFYLYIKNSIMMLIQFYLYQKIKITIIASVKKTIIFADATVPCLLHI